jgi:tetratricopeptide (TPR) repeat protein
MSKATATAPAQELPALTTISSLFTQCRKLEGTHDIRSARALERQVAALVAEIAASSPNSADHAEALALHEYVLLSLSRTSKRKDVSKSMKNAAYAQGAASVAIQLGLDKPGLGACFATYNLAIDLISTEKRSQEGLDWMLKAEALLNKLAGKKKLPRTLLNFKLFSIKFGIAKALYDLGDLKKARRILKRSLALAPSLKGAKWDELRDVSRASELLAQIYLDEMDAARA